MKNLLLYMHGGSDNHGCEAIVRSTCKILKGKNYNKTLLSYRPETDIKYGLNTVIEEISGTANKTELSDFTNRFKRKFFNNSNAFLDYEFRDLFKKAKEFDFALSIGGDNYCYDNASRIKLAYLKDRLNSYGVRTVLWGCSIDPTVLSANVIKDLAGYSLITARESITYEALKSAGITKSLRLCPDPAFILDKTDLPLPSGFTNNTIGLNISPYACPCGASVRIYNNFNNLISYILSETDCNIALIPHVVYEKNSDMPLLIKLHEKFCSSGRVILLEDHNCEELKGFISRCRIFIGARTHAIIAAYSSYVPALAIGYSIKAKGIAKDIFGSHKDYVADINELSDEQSLISSFKFILKNEDNIRSHLAAFMPSYTASISAKII